jgi:hypothetical protein
MKSTPVWRALLLLAGMLLACTFTSQGSYLPPTETPQAVADEDQDEQDDQDQNDEEDQDQGDEDIDLDNDLDLGGLGGDDEDQQDQDEQDQDEQDQDEQDQDEQDQDEDQQDQDEQDQDEQDQDGDCTPFRASGDAFWVTLNEDFEIEDQVSSYPRGTTLITPVFEYDCAPDNVDVVSVFSYDGEVVYSDEESVQPSTGPGLYGYPLGTTDNSALSDGRYGIEFYVGDDLIADGAIDVGGEGGNDQNGNEMVPVEGSVVSANSGQPIEDAQVLILNPGVTVQAWIDANYPDSDIYTGAYSDSRGAFTLPDPMERNVEYSLVVVAEGFQPLAVDGMVIGDDLEPPVFLEIELAE